MALAAGLMLGTSAASGEEARGGPGASYVGAGPAGRRRRSPTADPAIGLEGLREICNAISIPVIAIGGIDAGNARQCLDAGAYGVAVVRATDSRAVSEALAAG